MTTITIDRAVVERALELLGTWAKPPARLYRVMDNLRAALAQQDEPVEPVAWLYQNMYTEQEYLVWKKGTGGRNWTPLYTAPPRCPNCSSLEAQNTELDRKLAELEQAYEAVYRAGQAHEREECAKLCEARFVGDLNREDMEARRCAAAIRARGNT